MNFSVTQFGKPLDPSLYSWDEKTRTFAANECDLVLDFNSMHGITFKTGSFCTFKTGSNCTFDTGWNCFFDTGNYCVFKTGHSCTFKTGSNCTFTTGTCCQFNTGSRCTFKTGANCRFNTGDLCTFTTWEECVFEVGEKCLLIYTWNGFFEIYKLEPNKLVLLTKDGKLESLLGQILTTPHNIIWWKDGLKTMIKVGCQTHSIEFWKTNYKMIAKENGFQKDLIPEFLQHLKTIENSLQKTHSTKQKQKRNALGQFCKNIP